MAQGIEAAEQEEQAPVQNEDEDRKQKAKNRRKQTFVWLTWQSDSPTQAIADTAKHLCIVLLGLLPLVEAYNILLLPQVVSDELEVLAALEQDGEVCMPLPMPWTSPPCLDRGITYSVMV